MARSGRFAFLAHGVHPDIVNRFLILALVAAFFATGACGQSSEPGTPDEIVKGAVEGVLAAIREDSGAKSGDVSRIAKVVEQKFLPATDFQRTIRIAVGPAWQSATAEQQHALFEQFQILVTRVYALELTQISDQSVKFHYQPAAPIGGDGDVLVKTKIVTNGDESDIQYRLARSASGWKIYDINILGSWLSTLYQRQFSDRLAQGGIDALTKTLREKNSRSLD